ncbi:MAG: UDP-N-acetylmuramoyl-L-alanyl-D-glutamate--2,6-diaminopimelate ligase [Clostridiales bacterium]|nr:UDP-N-acetylmuramoyl-L-alanyl-D-glutamate--2,6-diaminopimelate ligase [Clostridiales bacterium]
MLLKKIFGDCDFKYRGKENVENLDVSAVCRDSRDCEDGVYFCLTNDFNKANARCLDALKNGAKVVVSNFDLPYQESILVDDSRESFSLACANFYDRACDDLRIVGITGTNGKTSTSHIVAQMLQRNGHKTGVIGTSGVFYNGKTFDCPLTTPDADFLHRAFYEMRQDGVEFVVMEVSAHAIDQKRVAGINFELGVLTNITQDHLDYFNTIEEYERVKLSFFDRKFIKKGVVCADDPRARKLFENCNVPLVSYGLENPCDVFAIDVSCGLNGSKFFANVCDEIFAISTNLIGQYNVYNSLAALGICQSLGLDGNELQIGLNYINPVEGRFNVIKVGDKYAVIDFAHSPDGLLNVLKATRELTQGRVLTVFGCGGNRDTSKRPQMGEIAEQYADVVCLTDDNPRCESSKDIIADIEKGMSKHHFVEANRAKAIGLMLDIAQSGDIVVIAGKGAEKYQEIGHTKFPYNDFEAVYNYCKQKKEKEVERKLL